MLNVAIAVTGLLHLFSRKERAKRRHAQQEAEYSPVQVPSAYTKDDYYPPAAGPRSAHPRPLSSFAPDLSRQSYYHAQYAQYAQHAQHAQQPRASCDQPPLPTYDPSKYQPQPSRPTSIPNYDLSSWQYPYNRQSSQLSAAHYNPRGSVYQPVPAAGVGPFPAPLPFESAPSNRRQSAMPFRPMSDKLEPRTGRERSSSEPLQVEPGRQQDSSGRRRAKPVLSRLITNF
ncbi:hypothetical protein N7468_006483 [Penicillium chermesinum]|uniref:Uncharacterized protein n=1 Tax=Penicillium chermesinum TaxID=63820 RepID=A0A9W9TJQ2_9EURO|nr:uncharacterized protein N7468_006483 [Penicillium chermesinum]KAJ5225258.1 hypothetical protein N7468_006483 [Penicillium chermesinum]